MDGRTVVEHVKQYIRSRHPWLHHPFVIAVYEGRAPRDAVREFLRQYWVIPKTHVINNAGKLAHAHLHKGSALIQLLKSPYDAHISDLLGESVMDELGRTAISPVNHYEPYLRLTRAFGIRDEELGTPESLLPQTLLTMYAWTQTALQFSLLELLSSHNLVNDTVQVIAFPRLCEALIRNYGVSEADVEWFRLHGDVDVEHGSRSSEIIADLIETPDDELTVWNAAKLGIAIKTTLFDGVWAATTGSKGIANPW